MLLVSVLFEMSQLFKELSVTHWKIFTNSTRTRVLKQKLKEWMNDSFSSNIEYLNLSKAEQLYENQDIKKCLLGTQWKF